jgi:hypothetical protein
MLSGAIGPRVCDDQRGAGGETPPFQNAKGGGIRRAVVRSPAVTVARHAQARPPPLVPVWVPTTDAATLLFLPPALSLLHPALYLIFVLLTPARNSASLLTAPPSLSSSWRQQRRRPAQRRSHEGTVAGGRQAAGYPVRVVVVPATQGGGGMAQNTAHCCSRDRAADQSDGGFLVVVIVVGGSVGGGRPRRRLPGAEAAAEAAAAVGCGHDYYVVFLVGGGDLLDVNGSFYLNAKKISVCRLVQNLTSLLTSSVQAPYMFHTSTTNRRCQKIDNVSTL